MSNKGFTAPGTRTNFAEQVSYIALRVRGEVHGDNGIRCS